mgnify:CR=1 FL=1
MKIKKVVWITGGGTGIGKELAKLFSYKDYTVIISGRRLEKLSETSRYNPKKIIPMKLDVSNPKDCLRVSKKIYNRYGFIDLIILNAAIYSPGSIKEINTNEIKKVVDVNLLGQINCLSFALEKMKDSSKGHIIFISSPAGYRGLPGAGMYGVTKSAITFLAETSRLEFSKFNIKVQVVHPGFVKTPMTDKNQFKMPFLMSPEEAAKRIFNKLQSNDFEIFFPKRLIYPMKLLSILPDKIYFFLIKNLVKVSG